ncbi:hypothetical protein LCGC14_2099830 [marine sediment metagenome]|uniref:Uncharacterized protein n=1 Tax=marine sediment metagenome TaxID=412755 RepID=A0A0F9EA68_9ZZZZ
MPNLNETLVCTQEYFDELPECILYPYLKDGQRWKTNIDNRWIISEYVHVSEEKHYFIKNMEPNIVD